jgi:hypothetical protein
VQHPAVSNDSASSNNKRATDASTRRIVQLRTSEKPPASTKPAAPVVLVLKNGRVLETRGYVFARDRLWIVTPSGSEQIALSQLDVPATQVRNLTRGIQFPNLQSR